MAPASRSDNTCVSVREQERDCVCVLFLLYPGRRPPNVRWLSATTQQLLWLPARFCVHGYLLQFWSAVGCWWESKSSTKSPTHPHAGTHTQIHTYRQAHLTKHKVLRLYCVCWEELAYVNSQMYVLHLHDDLLTHLHGALRTCSAVLQIIRMST